MARNKWSQKVTGIKISEVDLEALSELSSSPFFPLLLRTSTKLTALWKDQSFKLDELDPNFQLKHQRFVERAIGIRMFLRFIEESGKRLGSEE